MRKKKERTRGTIENAILMDAESMGYAVLTDERKEDDLRLPNALVSHEQFIALTEKMAECNRAIEENPDDPHNCVKKGTKIYDEHYAYRPVFLLLKEYEEEMEKDGTDVVNTCIMCGNDKKDSTIRNSPVCYNCYRKLRNGNIPNLHHARGTKNFNKVCVICGEKPAGLYNRGCCTTCYRRGDYKGDHSLETLRKLYLRAIRKKVPDTTLLTKDEPMPQPEEMFHKKEWAGATPLPKNK